MTTPLTGRTAIVTGASRGLGREIAMALAAAGASVAVAARTETVWDDRLPGTIGDTVAEIQAAGGQAIAIPADLLVHDDVTRIVELTREAFGPITILVNNAAFTAPGRPSRPAPPATAPGGDAGKTDWPAFLGTPLSAYRRHFDIAVFAAYELMQMVCPDMIAAGHGSIVNVSSGASRIPGDGPYTERSTAALPGYGGSKAALEHLTQCAALELQKRNIAVNALSPSKAIRTPGLDFYAPVFDDLAPAAEFAEAVVRLVQVDPNTVTGMVIGHGDVLNGSFRPYTFSPA